MHDVLEQLRTALKQADESQYAIAQATGINKSVLSRFASGETGLAFHTAERLAEHLGYDIVLQLQKRRRRRKGTGHGKSRA